MLINKYSVIPSPELFLKPADIFDDLKKSIILRGVRQNNLAKTEPVEII